MKKKPDPLPATIEAALADLLSEKCKLTPEEKDAKRKDLILAIKWQAVKSKMDSGEWGAGFGEKEESEEEPEDE